MLAVGVVIHLNENAVPVGNDQSISREWMHQPYRIPLDLHDLWQPRKHSVNVQRQALLSLNKS
jgi:hypothetical protein